MGSVDEPSFGVLAGALADSTANQEGASLSAFSASKATRRSSPRRSCRRAYGRPRRRGRASGRSVAGRHRAPGLRGAARRRAYPQAPGAELRINDQRCRVRRNPMAAPVAGPFALSGHSGAPDPRNHAGLAQRYGAIWARLDSEHPWLSPFIRAEVPTGVPTARARAVTFGR